MSALPSKEMNFLRDLAALLIEEAQAAKADAARKKKEGQPSDWESGQAFAFYRALSLIEQQATGFGLSREDVGLAGFSADSLLAEEEPIQPPETTRGK
jgi:hypothetical protein